MADLPETLTLTLNFPPTAVTAGSTVQAVATIGLGVPGTKGDTGANGTTPTLTGGTVSTLSPGASATASLVSLGGAAYRLDLGLPKGDPGAGSGDVSGPAASVDNNVVLFSGTTGKVIKDSGVLFGNIVQTSGSNFTNTGLRVRDTDASHSLIIAPGSSLTADRTLTVTTGDANRTLSLGGNLTTANAFTTSGAFALTLTVTGTTNVTLPTTGTLAILGANTFTGKQTTPASAAGGAGFNLPHGAAPTTPTDGDVWTTTAGIFVRVNGATLGPLISASSVPTKATASDVRTGTDDVKFTTAKAIRDAMAFVALTDAATIAVDMGAGFNFSVTLGGNRTLGAPTNSIEGQSGLILVTQDGTGSRTLSFNTAWKFAGGTPTASTAAGTVDAIAYTVTTGGASPIIRATYIKAFA